jgi:hypothetical protein
MRFNKDRLALLAGIDDRDQYFGKTLRENFTHGLAVEAEDDLDAVEDEDEMPLDAEGGDEEMAEEGGDEEMVSKEEVADAVADVLGVDPVELAALVAGDEEAAEGDEEAEEGGDEEVADLELEESEEEKRQKDANYLDGVDESRIRRAIRKEIASVVNEARRNRTSRQMRAARRTKSVAVAMGFKKTRK